MRSPGSGWVCSGLDQFALLLMSSDAGAQTSPGTLPPMGGIGGPVQFGNQPPLPIPAPGNGIGFGSIAPAPAPLAAPSRPNLADELTDFRVPPQDTLKAEVGSETPLSIPGAHVITTDLV